MNTKPSSAVLASSCLHVKTATGVWSVVSLADLALGQELPKSYLVFSTETGQFHEERWDCSNAPKLIEASPLTWIDFHAGKKVSCTPDALIMVAPRPKFRYDTERLNLDGTIASSTSKVNFIRAEHLKSGVFAEVYPMAHAQHSLTGSPTPRNAESVSKVRRHDMSVSGSNFATLPRPSSKRVVVLASGHLMV